MDTPREPPANFTGERLSESKRRRRQAEALFDTVKAMGEEGMANPAYVYDEEHDLFRFAYDGVFAFSREHANWAELRRRGMLD